MRPGFSPQRLGRRLGKTGLAALLALTLSPFGATGCGPDEEAKPAPTALAADAEWRWLQDSRRSLEEKRAQLAQAEAAARSAAPQPATQPNAQAGPQAPQDDVARRRQEVDALSTELRRRLVDFINADPPVEGRPMTPRQQEALRMKSDEEILVAQDFIQRGGDYRRAIEIYQAALSVDPGNPRLRQELEKARGMRYMSRERFSQVKEGMTQDEVRTLLGQPNLHNVREYTERKVSAWFYPKGPEGAAAAVWFERSGSGPARVYERDFDAVPPAPAAAPAGRSPARPAPPARRPPASPGLTSDTE
ncbi:MAG TPA: hypothetical protein VEL74_00575 [Thermoanaerobaculia bacterium]|nr:hypothetical protein [Thermoanaerobaculia bacterium]